MTPTGRLMDPSVAVPPPTGPRPDRRSDRPGPGSGSDIGPGGAAGAAHRTRDLVVAGAIYLAASVWVFSDVWTHHPRTTSICGCGDTSLFTWFLDWPAYAVAHGLDPFASTAMGYPHGINLLANTGVVAIGFVLAPVTWLFGAVASVNVALTLSPFLSALALFVLLRRWTAWVPAAFVGGLVYGFSPYLLFTLTNAHLMLGMAFVPPLVVLCLDELLVGRRHRPVVVGVLLGVLVAVQFFLGTEVLAITAIAAAFGLFGLVLYGLLRPIGIGDRVTRILTGLGAAAVTAGVLLAYPLWFMLAGPAHLSGPVWGPADYGSYGGTSPGGYLVAVAPNAINTDLTRWLGGYQAPTFTAQYFGWGMVVVLVVGTVLWRRDRRLWLFGGVGAVSVALSFGLHQHGWTPWRLFMPLPEMDNLIPMRFLMVTYLCAAVMLAVIVDHTHAAVGRLATARGGDSSPWLRRLAAPAVAVAVALVAVVPVVSFFSGYLPLTMEPVQIPSWFRTEAPRLEHHQVLLVLPDTDGVESPLSWQVAAGLHFSMVDVGGPQGAPFRAGREAPGQAVLSALSYDGPRTVVTGADLASVRRALTDWGVTMVVLPDQPTLPTYDHVPSPETVAALVTAATGIRPAHQDQAWVWSDVRRRPPRRYPSTAQFAACTARTAGGQTAPVPPAVTCVLSA